MKLPGIGEVKNQYVYIGAGVSVVGVIWWRRKSQAAKSAAAASVAQSQTDSGIDPNTGMPISDGSGVGGYAGYGGIDPGTGVPFIYESGATGNTNNQTGITTNSQWAQQAEGDLVSTFGFSFTVAQSAVSKYMAQLPSGLNDQEYQAMSDAIAELGMPPNGTFRLIHAPTINNPGGTQLPVLHSGEVLRVPYNVGPGQASHVADKFGISLAHLLSENPGKTGKETAVQVYMIPYQVKPHDTLFSVASLFGISEEHLAQFVPTS